MEGEIHELRPSLARRIGREIRNHRYAYVVTIGFAVAGAVTARMLFPEVSPLAGAVGGLALGVYAALNAVPNKFLE